jgi:hypothetical protein
LQKACFYTIDYLERGIQQNPSFTVVNLLSMSELLESQPVARQVDYDAFTKDLMDSNGLSIEEAAEEAIETFSTEYDTVGLFLYRNKREYDEKVKVETRCKTIENASKGIDSFINANFAFQGLIKILKDSDNNVKQGIWHMFESRGLLGSLIQLLAVNEREENENEKTPLGEVDSDDSDEEDEDEAKILQTVAVLEFSLLIIQTALTSPQYLRSIETFCFLDEMKVQIVRNRFDEDVAEKRVVEKMIDFLSILLNFEQNKIAFKEASGVDVLDLSVKMHKKNTDLVTRIQTLTSKLI